MLGYEVLKKLADGSAAEMFLAREETSQNRVILEIIRPELTKDFEIYGRFLDEAKERQTLAHPNLVRRISTGCGPAGKLFVVTEPVPGDHLGNYLASHGALTPREMIALMVPVCDAVAYLHGRGVVHGHLRPANVFLTGDRSAPVPKLMDTGLSLFRSIRSVHNPKLVLVEPEYLSPERIKGKRADRVSDVYGLGVLMFEALTGKPPFTSGDAQKTRQLHVEGKPPALPKSCERLAPIIAQCLAKNPSKRFQSAAALRDALSSLAEDSLPTGPRTPAPASSRDTAERAQTVMSVDSADELVVGEPAGDVIGSYELERQIGQGGMGRVYLAKHTRIGRQVALKVLKEELVNDPLQLQRFFLEARSVNRINHEHIVEIYDFVCEPKDAGGRVYFVMEALHGQTLKQATKKRPMRVGRAVAIGRQICAALEAAHKVGVVHRDVKPDNIFLIEKNGRADFVKMLDFGVAKLRDGDAVTAMTHSGMVLGTPAYMAPEQAMGESVDHRADIYALGSVLFAVLTGKPPFEEKGLGPLIAALVTKPPPPLPEKNAAGDEIPAGLRALVARCLEKDPARRFASMAELSEALAAFEHAEAPASAAASPGKAVPQETAVEPESESLELARPTPTSTPSFRVQTTTGMWHAQRAYATERSGNIRPQPKASMKLGLKLFVLFVVSFVAIGLGISAVRRLTAEPSPSASASSLK